MPVIAYGSVGSCNTSFITVNITYCQYESVMSSWQRVTKYVFQNVSSLKDFVLLEPWPAPYKI